MKVCSFCGRTEEQTKRIITSPKADICGECVLLCLEILIGQLDEYKEVPLKKGCNTCGTDGKTCFYCNEDHSKYTNKEA